MRCTGRFHNTKYRIETADGRLVCIECKEDV